MGSSDDLYALTGPGKGPESEDAKYDLIELTDESRKLNGCEVVCQSMLTPIGFLFARALIAFCFFISIYSLLRIIVLCLFAIFIIIFFLLQADLRQWKS